MTFVLRGVPRLNSSVLNGAAVAVGIALLQGVLSAWVGHALALTAVAGAVCASLADQPVAPFRLVRRTAAAAVMGVAVTVVVGALRTQPPALASALALIGFAGALVLAWGPRAGPLSFVGTLAFVFTMAAPAPTGPAAAAVQAGWAALGAVLYLAWSAVVNLLLQPVYRRLALVAVLDTSAALLRQRAVALAHGPSADDQGRLAGGLAQQTLLDEQLQAARDLLLAAADRDDTARRQAALLLGAIDLRENLLVSELDLALAGTGPAAQHLFLQLARVLAGLADSLDALAQAVCHGRALPPRGAGTAALADALRALEDTEPRDVDPAPAVHAGPTAVPAAAPSAVDTLRGALRQRLHHLLDDLVRLQALAEPAHAAPPLPLPAAQLQLFVSPEGWPLAALRAQFTVRSAVLRHAVRVAVALPAAYGLGLALPWASHPYWLVLSVAVVLRGNLEQTLSRLAPRVGGTLAGCVLVLALAQVPWQGLWLAVFFVSVGVAHAFVTRRYVLTAGAASVMALIQVHLAHPAAGFPVPERMADTLIGAALAWAFCFVLPSWERSALPRLVQRSLRALAGLVQHSLRPTADGAAGTAQRLARREAHQALLGVAQAAQRTAAEPPRVRLALPLLAQLLLNGRAMVAGLASVRLLLLRRGHELPAQTVESLLQASAQSLAQRLQWPPPATAQAPAWDAAASADSEQALLPPGAAGSPASLLLWLQRRLRLLNRQAAQLQAAAQGLCGSGVPGGYSGADPSSVSRRPS